MMRILKWVPVPLWCYAVPMAAVSLGWLPRAHPAYRALTEAVLPFALALLLLGIDLPSVMRAGWRALLAMVLGSTSIILGAPLVAWLLRAQLPPEAWTGIGCLAGTWTGGSMNLLALRAVLHTPEAMFTSLIIVDALIAYGWMALLMALAPRQAAWDRWVSAPGAGLSEIAPPAPSRHLLTSAAGGALLAAGIVVGSRALASLVPPPQALVSSQSGWVVLLVTTLSLGASLMPVLRRIGAHSERLGQFGLYLVLAAMGAQASLAGLWSAPVWLLVGLGVALVHGVVMIVGGRLLRLPLGLLATASQANFGGVVSAPLVGAIYEKRLVPIGLCLAIGANALGTYLGLGAALLTRFLLH